LAFIFGKFIPRDASTPPRPGLDAATVSRGVTRNARQIKSEIRYIQKLLLRRLVNCPARWYKYENLSAQYISLGVWAKGASACCISGFVIVN